MIITVSRQMGAGGAELARRVADALGWRVVDNELVEAIAARAGLPATEVALKEEQAPGFFDRLLRTLTTAAPEIQAAPDEVAELEEAKLVAVTESVVADVAREGRIVLVGRAASAVLSTDRDALHVKVVAPKEARVRAVAERAGLDADVARDRVEASDASRSRYHRQYYHRDWNDAAHYHLVLNSAALGLEAAVATVVGRAKGLWPDATKERRSAPA